MPEWVVEEEFICGKRPDAGACEDMIVDTVHFAAVIDGATDKSGWSRDGMSGGRLAASLLAEAVSNLPPGAPPAAIEGRLTAALAGEPGFHAIPVTSRPSASIVLLDKSTSTVHRIGDTSWKSNRRVRTGRKLIDRVASDARAALLRALIEAGDFDASTHDEDPGRTMILPLLLAQSHFRNNRGMGRFAFGALDGTPVPEKFVESWTLEPDERTLVLCTDGYPKVFMTLASSEGYLARNLEADPLRIGRHASTKRVTSDLASYDDRAFLKLSR